MRKHLMEILGAAAFIAGGLFAREKAFEVVETIDRSLKRESAKKPNPTLPADTQTTIFTSKN